MTNSPCILQYTLIWVATVLAASHIILAHVSEQKIYVFIRFQSGGPLELGQYSIDGPPHVKCRRRLSLVPDCRSCVEVANNTAFRNVSNGTRCDQKTSYEFKLRHIGKLVQFRIIKLTVGFLAKRNSICVKIK